MPKILLAIKKLLFVIVIVKHNNSSQEWNYLISSRPLTKNKNLRVF
jgi:hypothetical protein